MQRLALHIDSREPNHRVRYRSLPTFPKQRSSSSMNHSTSSWPTLRIGKLVDAGDQDIRAAGGMVFNAPIKLLAGLSGWKDACTIRTTINSTHPTISPPPNANSATTSTTVPTDCCDIWLVFGNFPPPGLATQRQFLAQE